MTRNHHRDDGGRRATGGGGLPSELRRAVALDRRNPFRPPDWRWQLAQRLCEEDRRAAPCPDPWVRRAVDFLRRWRRLRRTGDWPRLLRDGRFRDLFWLVFWKFEQPDRESRERAAALFFDWECYILAGATAEQIEERLGMDGKKQQLYEKLFFDVRSRRKHPAVILRSVIGAPRSGGNGRLDWPVFLKTMAYFGGMAVVDHLLTPTGEMPRSRQEAQAFLGAVVQNAWRVAAAYASQSDRLRELPPERLWKIVREGEAAESSASGSEESRLLADFQAGFEVFSEYFAGQLCVGHTGDASCDAPAAEARFDEELAVMLGEMSQEELNAKLRAIDEEIRQQGDCP